MHTKVWPVMILIIVLLTFFSVGLYQNGKQSSGLMDRVYSGQTLHQDSIKILHPNRNTIIRNYAFSSKKGIAACGFMPQKALRSPAKSTPSSEPVIEKSTISQTNLDFQQILTKYKGKEPQQWGETVSGVTTALNTDAKVLALTLDACGGSIRSNGYDSKLIDYLVQSHIPATLFISGRWIEANPALFEQLALIPLFSIENHGFSHLPCSVNGKSAYGIKGTKNITELLQEVENNGALIQKLTRRKPALYRSGTNYYDEISVAAIKDLGYTTVGYSVLGDAGATFSQKQVKGALLSAKPGSIIILHMNHPEGQTAEGVMEALPILQKQGFTFVKLSSAY